MLRALGVIFYFLAVGALFAALLAAQESGILAVAILASAISSAFFGAMCFAADEALALLRTMAGVPPLGQSSALAQSVVEGEPLPSKTENISNPPDALSEEARRKNLGLLAVVVIAFAFVFAFLT